MNIAQSALRGCLILGMAWLTPLATAAPLGSERSVPTTSYFAAFGYLCDGDYPDALKSFQSEGRSAIKNAQSRWIDSICYEAMCGECYYQMGILDKALNHFTAALELYKAYPDWMTKVRFEPAIRAAGAGARKVVPWGASSSQAPLGNFRPSELISQGQVNMSDVIQRGGVVQQANLMSICPQEIVRATCLALRRRAELLGPVSAYDPLNSDVATAMSGSIGPPNHWSETWGTMERALSLIATGKEDKAYPLLQRAVLASGEFNHPLTSIALLELGRLSLAKNDYRSAAKYFEEATFAAVNYPDYGVLEEAFRYRALVHLLSNNKGYFAPLDAAAQWAKAKNLRQFRASLLLCAAENHAVLGETRLAEAAIKEAMATIGRRKMGAGVIGARLNYLTALVNYQQRRTADGNAALASAMGYMQHGSHWLFHIAMADQIFVSGNATARVATDLFSKVLRDPQPADWAMNPMESLAVMMAPHFMAYEHWLDVTMERKETQSAIAVSERIRRHRFLISMEMGGRLESLRWLLESPSNDLPKAAAVQRQDLLSRYPAYEKLSRTSQTIRNAAGQKPLVAKDPEAVKEQTKALTELAATGASQEAILREIAVRREPATIVFPPLKSLEEVQNSLPEKHAVLSFFATSRRMYGVLLNRERCTLWQVQNFPALLKQMQTMLRDMGNYQQNHDIDVKDLGDTKWKQSAKQILDGLLKGSPADFTQPFEELVIIPDGALWYLPFEALQVTTQGRTQPLIARFRIRYAPTLSLSVLRGPARSSADTTAVVLGKLIQRDEEGSVQKAFEQLSTVIPNTVALKSPPPAPTSIYGTLFRRLLVFDEIVPSEQDPYGWALAPLDRGKPGSSLADWLLLPWGGPDVVVLPGFHTASEDAMKRLGKTPPGQDLFLATCGMMANGARTILLSRWRTGGQTSFDLVKEFLQELPNTSPADAWQRAVTLTASSRLNLDAEPRIKHSPSDDESPKATHPFFWSGYLLIDCGTSPNEQAVRPVEVPGKQQPNAGPADEELKPVPSEKPLEKPGKKRGERTGGKKK
jgi:CHAT domain-containing protein